MQEPFGGVFALLSALFNVLVNDHNLGDTVCMPLIGLLVTFNPLRMLYLHCHRLAPVVAIFNRAAIRRVG